MKSQESNDRYFPPEAKAMRLSTKVHILAGSLGGNPSINDYRGGSESCVGFGDED